MQAAVAAYEAVSASRASGEDADARGEEDILVDIMDAKVSGADLVIGYRPQSRSPIVAGEALRRGHATPAHSNPARAVRLHSHATTACRGRDPPPTPTPQVGHDASAVALAVCRRALCR